MKSTKAERAQRINAALSLIQKHDTISKAAKSMAAQYDISKRQAYRYIHEANEAGEKVPIPDSKIAFTVKLSQSLIQRLRKYTKVSGESLSEIVTQSLEAFLQNGRGHQKKQQKR